MGEWVEDSTSDVKSDQYPGAAPPILDNAAPGNNDHTMISDESMFNYRNTGHHKPDTRRIIP